ncbi:hypothetical protein O6H91_10G039100 [Diphasiastrum complanatum]|uniref:Uncharacterized protein n=1 Tax=Diphasiastrum complanatum TaxID=34168 RepID=A0ACC2CG57_DIPCM|nr:hypothetical protein O6H91_Y289600 [Diphasiastrum complanatum]KAJ7540966.1 hypothetical protein O6H91_10G039100 [Diphasiastrum complanatum]
MRLLNSAWTPQCDDHSSGSQLPGNPCARSLGLLDYAPTLLSLFCPSSSSSFFPFIFDALACLPDAHRHIIEVGHAAWIVVIDGQIHLLSTLFGASSFEKKL